MSDKEVKVKEKKEKKQKGKSYGLHKGRTTVLWLLFISAFAFAVYKNFTGIDRHTVHEKEIIKVCAGFCWILFFMGSGGYISIKGTFRSFETVYDR